MAPYRGWPRAASGEIRLQARYHGVLGCGQSGRLGARGTSLGAVPFLSGPDAAAPPIRCRLVLEQGEEGAVALLYPPDANAYATPLGVVPLDPYQELPRVPVGDLVELDAPPLPGTKLTLRCQDGLAIAPRSPVQSSNSHALRPFAERGAQVLVHPDVVGTRSSWRHAPSLSGFSAAAWEVVLVRKHCEGVMSMAVGVVLFVGGAILLVTSGRGRGSAVGISLFCVGLAGVIRAKKSLKALRRARQARSAPPQRMRVRLWWSIGRGSGPAAMISLAPLTSSHPDEDTVHFEAVNVPPQVPSGKWTEAEVRGDPSEGGTPIVRLGDIEIWPVTEATRALRRPSWADRWRKSAQRGT